MAPTTVLEHPSGTGSKDAPEAESYPSNFHNQLFSIPGEAKKLVHKVTRVTNPSSEHYPDYFGRQKQTGNPTS